MSAFSVRVEPSLPKGRMLVSRGGVGEIISGAPGTTVADGATTLGEGRDTNVNKLVAVHVSQLSRMNETTRIP